MPSPKLVWLAYAAFASATVPSAILAQAPYFATVVRSYADTMLEHGRDTYNKPTPQFVTKLSRTSQPTFFHEGNLAAVSGSKKLPGWDSRYYDRSWGGANMTDHIQLHELLVQLSKVTGDPKYKQASKDELDFIFNNTLHPATSLLIWGEHLSWDVRKDGVFSNKKSAGTPHSDTHELKDQLSREFWDSAR